MPVRSRPRPVLARHGAKHKDPLDPVRIPQGYRPSLARGPSSQGRVRAADACSRTRDRTTVGGVVVELRLMRYVVAVADEGGFQRAAERLHMAQPPLSRQIRGLARELGVRLFDRRPTRLTEPGRVFVESARKVLADADGLVEATRRAGRGETGGVRLGYVPSAAHEPLPRLLAAMAEERPGVRVDVREAWSAELDLALREERVDVGLARGLSGRDGDARETLGSEPLVVVLGERHPLAGRDEVHLRDLRGY